MFLLAYSHVIALDQVRQRDSAIPAQVDAFVVMALKVISVIDVLTDITVTQIVRDVIATELVLIHACVEMKALVSAMRMGNAHVK